MPTIYVTSAEPGTGKTGVATAIARHYAYQGVPTGLIRFADGGSAEADAEFFSRQPFAPGSPAAPVDPASYAEPTSRDLAVVEGNVENAPTGSTVVYVASESLGDVPEGLAPSVIVVTRVARGDDASLPETVGESRVIAVREDRTLAGFSIESVQRLLHADVLVEGDPEDTTCDHLVVAPIGSDAGQPYFRRFTRAAVVARYDKTDMQLAAIRGKPVLLILTGGRRPSEYLFDAAGAEGVPVLLSRTDTENTIIALEGIFDETRFEGAAKTERMVELLEATDAFDALGIEVPLPSGS